MFVPLWRRGQRLSFRAGAKDDEDLADMLHGVCGQRIADVTDQALTLAAVIAKNADLDEFVTLERQVDFFQHPGREAGLPDHDDRMQMMRTGPERAPLGGRKFHHLGQSWVVCGI